MGNYGVTYLWGGLGHLAGHIGSNSDRNLRHFPSKFSVLPDFVLLNGGREVDGVQSKRSQQDGRLLTAAEDRN